MARVIALLIAASLAAGCSGSDLYNLAHAKEIADRDRRENEAWRANHDAQRALFRKVLSGDKLNLFENAWVENRWDGSIIYDAHGDPLNTPEQLAGAAEWFTVLGWSDAATPSRVWSRSSCTRAFGHGRWTRTLRKHTFSGDKATGQAIETIVCSDAPPSNANQ